MSTITFQPKDMRVDVPRGFSVLEAAMEFHVPIYHTCGGNASCSTCRVKVLRGAENLSSMEEAEKQVLEAFDLPAPYRLGCQALLMQGEIEVEIPKRVKPCRDNKTPPLPAKA